MSKQDSLNAAHALMEIFMGYLSRLIEIIAEENEEELESTLREFGTFFSNQASKIVVYENLIRTFLKNSTIESNKEILIDALNTGNSDEVDMFEQFINKKEL